MAPATPRLRILSVGGNAVSAFLSWRLQATNACDVTLVWKSNYEAVAQYGISFKSKLFGNQRFKPYAVVRSTEEAAAQASKTPYDYVFLCVKALPDVYDIATIIEPVVAPQHTCILINTTSALGVEPFLEQRFPTNVVLSLVSGADIIQLGPSEFEHRDTTDIWVGAANKNPSIPASIQADMADALAMTLCSGQVECQVSSNIRQQQYERMIGPIAFHPASVLFETPNHTELLEKVGVRELVTSVINELLHLAETQGCKFPADFREKSMEQMLAPADSNSTMYQDYLARRPMEIETFLASPIKLAQEMKLTLPRVETVYAMMHHLNQVNQTRQMQPPSPNPAGGPPPRLSSAPTPRGGPPTMNGQMNGAMKNGMGRPRMSTMNGAPPPGMMRRGPPNGQGFPPRMANGNGYGPPGGPQKLRRASLDGNDLEEFSHIMLYENVPEGGLADPPNGIYDLPNGAPSTDDLGRRERELALREREMALRNQEMEHRRRQQRRPPPPGSHVGGFEDDDEEDFFEPMGARQPMIDPENFDMLSVTSRRNRRAVSSNQLRPDAEMGPPGPRPMFKRPPINKTRTSARLMADVPGLHDPITRSGLMGYSSNRYGAVDRQAIGQDSRSNSLTAARLNELERTGGGNYSAYPSMPSRRLSQSPGNPFSPGPRPGGRPSPPNGLAPNGAGPTPPGMRAPVPRHPPGHGNAVAPQQVEQHAGVSNLYPIKPAQVRSLTGSASASAGSGDSSHSAHLDSSENSAYSSQSSLGPRPAIGVR